MTVLLSDLPEGLAEVEGVTASVIPDLDALDPFLLTLVSAADHWCFLSTSGALTAGRRDADTALLPYETDDRLHEAAGTIGPVTVVRVAGPDGPVTWEPFGRCPDPRARRAAAKSVLGDVVWLEEVHPDLPLAFRCRWATSEAYGLVRRVQLVATGDVPVDVTVVDGLVGVLPHGVGVRMQSTMRNLVSAYRRSERVEAPLPMAVHALESLIVDQAIPAESLRATVTWSHAPAPTTFSVSDDVLVAARRGAADPARSAADLVTGRPGAHLLHMDLHVEPGRPAAWYLAADVAVGHVELAALRADLQATADLPAAVEASVAEGSRSLAGILATVDGWQSTGDEVACAHHLSNAMFNAMRGGVFADGGRVHAEDLRRFLHTRNREVAQRHAGWLAGLPEVLERDAMVAAAAATGDPHLHRLALEHLPLFFSRRHGDPSRPWNRFSIRLREADGTPVLGFEGNWRDIFQNWEALCQSFPAYLPGVVTAFVNASTADGFNPYRITREGIDWEVPDPEDPWSNIGYWGDHQVVYLLRLLEQTDRWLPSALEDLLDRRLFTFADVPYRLAPYDAILRDPRDTITYDEAAAARARDRADAIGGDGLLLPGPDGAPLRVTLLEKLLIPALSKLSVFVPDGGLWLHTQRPEWNDANNALVGNGLSMVTLLHLRRYLVALADLVGRRGTAPIELSAAVAAWAGEVTAALAAAADLADVEADPTRRADLMHQLGQSFQRLRDALAEDGTDPGPGPATTVAADLVTGLVDAALPLLDGTIRRARRDDGLYHSYNLLQMTADAGEARVGHLPEMLEGQVAALAAGTLDHEACADLLDSLRDSALHRGDQDSYLLYPATRPPAFVDKNVVPVDLVEANPLLRALREADRRDVIARDAEGVHRFAGDLANAADLAARLDALADDDRWADLAASHRDDVLAAWEAVFSHDAFTGRSGSMYAYEGLGSIYWHMVGKLLLAAQECAVAAHRDGADPQVVARLRSAYRRIRAGFGFTKPAATYGAFPTDAYSHTPAHAGAQQPGMTGQVKEMVLARPGELGVWVRGGRIELDPFLLDPAELHDGASSWVLPDATGRPHEVPLPPDALGLTVCQVPVVVVRAEGDHPRVEVVRADGTTDVVDGAVLDRGTTDAIARRTGAVHRIVAHLPVPT